MSSLVIMDAQDIEYNPELNLILYGPPGCGKTWMSMATKRYRQLHVTTEWKQSQGTFQQVKKAGKSHPNMQVAKVTSYADLLGVEEWLKSPVEGISGSTIADTFDLIVLDNLSDIQDFIKRDLLARDTDRKLDVLTQGEWQDLIDKTADLMVKFRDVSKHFVAIAHYNEIFSNEAKYVRPSMSGKSLPAKLSGYVNAMGYLFKTPTENGPARQILFDSGDDFMTKPHGDLLPLEDANLDLLIGKVLGKYNKADTLASLQSKAKKSKETK